MLVDAELFVIADEMLVEVLSRIREADLSLELPPLLERPDYDSRSTLRFAVQVHLRSEDAAQRALTGQEAVPCPAIDRTLPASALQAMVVAAAAVSSRAAKQAQDSRAILTTPQGLMSTEDYLRQLTLTRCLVAHYVAAVLGSTACPLPEELARPLWELTSPAAERWRARGYFRAPLPLPEHVSWRDRFLLHAGHEQHPHVH